MAHRDTAFPQRLDVQLASGSAKIIEADDLPRSDIVEQPMREVASHEAADSGDKDFHGEIICCRA
jgi:hypothetical protein